MSFADCKTKKDRVDYIRKAVAADRNWAIRGMLVVFDNQTADEQASEDTKHHNGIGFTGADAHLLTSFSKQVRTGRWMSTKQMALIFKKMPKYAAQLERAVQVKVAAAVAVDRTEEFRDPMEEERRYA